MRCFARHTVIRYEGIANTFVQLFRPQFTDLMRLSNARRALVVQIEKR
jgi:hypothetical protein